jgi:hypothetical protein
VGAGLVLLAELSAERPDLDRLRAHPGKIRKNVILEVGGRRPART